MSTFIVESQTAPTDGQVWSAYALFQQPAHPHPEQTALREARELSKFHPRLTCRVRNIVTNDVSAVYRQGEAIEDVLSHPVHIFTKSDVRSNGDRRRKVDYHVYEYRSEDGTRFRKGFETKRNVAPVVPSNGTHKELNARKRQW